MEKNRRGETKDGLQNYRDLTGYLLLGNEKPGTLSLSQIIRHFDVPTKYRMTNLF